jgi:hypothetical protein
MLGMAIFLPVYIDETTESLREPREDERGSMWDIWMDGWMDGWMRQSINKPINQSINQSISSFDRVGWDFVAADGMEMK